LYNVFLAQSWNVSVIFPSLWPQTTHVLTCGFSFLQGFLLDHTTLSALNISSNMKLYSRIVRTCCHLSRVSKEHNQVAWLQEL
jgi:hypothetical protein